MWINKVASSAVVSGRSTGQARQTIVVLTINAKAITTDTKYSTFFANIQIPFDCVRHANCGK
jgi:hypothetical protein